MNIRNGQDDYIYEGEPINIQYQYESEGGRSFGGMVLCDGIAVPFSASLNHEEEYLQIIQKGILIRTVDVDLYVMPVGKTGDVVSIEIVDIIEPD